MRVSLNTRIKLLIVGGWVGIAVVVGSLPAVAILRSHYVGDGNLSKATLSVYLRTLETKVETGELSLPAAFRHLERSHSMLIDAVLDYLWMPVVLMPWLLGASICVLVSARRLEGYMKRDRAATLAAGQGTAAE